MLLGPVTPRMIGDYAANNQHAMCLPPLWERSAAERCLIHAETVSLFQSLVDFQPMLKLSHLDHFR